MYTTRHRVLALLLSFTICLSAASAKVLQLSAALAIDQTDSDATFQELPEIGKDKYLCLWSGDALQGFLLTMHETTSLDWKAFLQATEKSMKKEGAKGIKIAERAVFKGADGAEVRRLDIAYKSEGSDVKQIYYVIKSDTGYHSVIVTLTNPAAYAAIGVRTDKLMATVKLGQAKK